MPQVGQVTLVMHALFGTWFARFPGLYSSSVAQKFQTLYEPPCSTV